MKIERMFSFLYHIFPDRFLVNFLEKITNIALRLQGIGSGAGVSASGEARALQKISHILNDEVTIFDIGSNKGQYAESVINAFQGKKLHLHCFEPSAYTFSVLSQTLSKYTDKSIDITLNNFALGKECGTAPLYMNIPGSGLASLTQRRLQHFDISMDNFEEVQINTVDKYVSENEIKNIDILKLDVEGHELDVFIGAYETLKESKCRFIQFEFGGCNIDTKTYFQDFWYLFNGIGYKIYRITPSGYLHKIQSYKEIYEQFVTTNFIVSKEEI